MTATNGHTTTNGVLDSYTKSCQDVSGPKAHPRAKFVLDALMKHLHAFAREVQLTNEEWLASCDLLIRSGQMSDARRNELILISDVLGLESLVDNMTHERAQAASSGAKVDATESAILGPFYRTGAPRYENGGDIVLDHTITSADGKRGETCLMHGKVTDASTGAPIVGAQIDIWHTGPNGLYEQQDEKQPDYNYRGRFTTDAAGYYAVRCLRPTAYPIPYDGGAGDILKLLDRSPMRPAHIHLLIEANGYKQLVTQIFDSKCEYIGADAVFADKSGLTVDFATPSSNEAKKSGCQTEVAYDIRLVADQ
ncbi:Intradiol ring-cleavage dioxygenase, C-terminal [Kalmanozyma brasiliensis GHG001]|uniref:Hydroxyquinol-1,2-dioxygenase n=1 Tax=Kalmanozyma brasiliensis (strain GHG001) TaxID=1365824 RepID=V5ET15_KALBG|nr:Intradiol ring-cleavage dioxygenase, C-terminal [Kalmanozyma brasiliensis GHG001]EST08390.1 Intradiol ring-cleavage dioxygenase, C-terminal [Kalmanozyma brasiliensis GHG001]